jgi:hypothetical protein
MDTASLPDPMYQFLLRDILSLLPQSIAIASTTYICAVIAQRRTSNNNHSRLPH